MSGDTPRVSCMAGSERTSVEDRGGRTQRRRRITGLILSFKYADLRQNAMGKDIGKSKDRAGLLIPTAISLLLRFLDP